VLRRPARALDEQTGKASIYGVLTAVAFIFLPVASALLVFLMVLFWGWFPGMVMGIFLFGALALVWFLSPLMTGLWLGQKLARLLGRETADLPALLGGVLVLVLLGRIPILGWFVYLVSFILAIGALVVSRQRVGKRLAEMQAA
jgi:hypothetical protein